MYLNFTLWMDIVYLMVLENKTKNKQKTSMEFHKHVLLAYNAVLSCSVTKYLEEINKFVLIKTV